MPICVAYFDVDVLHKRKVNIISSKKSPEFSPRDGAREEPRTMPIRPNDELGHTSSDVALQESQEPNGKRNCPPRPAKKSFYKSVYGGWTTNE